MPPPSAVDLQDKCVASQGGCHSTIVNGDDKDCHAIIDGLVGLNLGLKENVELGS